VDGARDATGTALSAAADAPQPGEGEAASAVAAESSPEGNAEALLLAALEPQPATMCVSVGPFRDLADATAAGAQLAERGLAPRQRSGEGVVWQGFWVYLPAHPDREAAQASLDRLKASGVSEAYIVPTGDDRNAIALGLLSERGRAERLAGQVGKLGFKPQIAERNRTDTVYWVDVEVEDAGAIDPLQFQTSPDRIARLRVVECPATPAR
jgi:cell division septation protein DedD